jgi:hypothetical protein
MTLGNFAHSGSEESSDKGSKHTNLGSNFERSPFYAAENGALGKIIARAQSTAKAFHGRLHKCPLHTFSPYFKLLTIHTLWLYIGQYLKPITISYCSLDSNWIVM